MNRTLLWAVVIMVMALVIERITMLVTQVRVTRRLAQFMGSGMLMPPPRPPMPPNAEHLESQQERAARVQIEFIEKMTRKLDAEDEGWKP